MERLKSKFYLLGIGSDAKTVKGVKYGYMTGILYLAPANLSGNEVCPSRTQGCSDSCLFTAGRGAFSTVRDARISKTQLLFSNRAEFLRRLRHDIQLLIKRAEAQGLVPCVRLNGTSDLGWEGIAADIIREFPDVQFYDYTKVVSRMMLYCKGKFPSNYHLTFSKSENNDSDCNKVLNAGGNVAVVFKNKPNVYFGYPVIDGDLSDLRFTDDKGVVVGLKAKGKAKQDTTGFVV